MCCGYEYANAQGEPGSTGPDIEWLGFDVDTLDVNAPDTLQLKPLIIEGTVQLFIDGVPLDSSSYELNYRTGELVLDRSVTATQIVAIYKTFPFTLEPFYQRRRPRSLDTVTDTSEVVLEMEERNRQAQEVRIDPFGNSNVQRSGSITRGIVAGNNRDVTLESGLRMQLSGEIIEGVQVQAVLTDENTPIQPEGTTQRLNEFDRVFIELAARQGTVQLGDFDLNFQESEFARFSRKLQGIRAFGRFKNGVSGFEAVKAPTLSVDVAGATARGIFQAQDIEPIDGVQGPYRLEGNQGEQFIIVVAGSEIVYLDGVQMMRGESNDYVIDYATGEVTFTANRIISSDRRISVEFQYTTNQFSRSLSGASVNSHFWRRDTGEPRVSIGMTFLREADGDLFNDEFGLSTADSLEIIQVGDGIAQRSGAIRVEFDPEAPYVHYVQEVITVMDGTQDTIFVAVEGAPPDSIPVFRVQFTRVGTGQGQYVRSGRQINGILFEYRGPAQGDYEPVRILPKPANHNVLDFTGRYELIRGVEVFGEWARSFNDENRFSSLDSQDDVDYAYKGGFRIKEIPLYAGFSEKGHVSLEANRRQVGQNFESFDRIRPIEFGRRWNLNSTILGAAANPSASADEYVEEINAQLYANPNLFVGGEVGRIQLGSLFESRRTMLETGGYNRYSYIAEWIESEDSSRGEDGRWFRQRGFLAQPFFAQKMTARFEFEQENRQQEAIGTDSLLAVSEAFTELRPGLAWNTRGVEAGLNVEFRTEKDWAEGRLRDAAVSRTYQSTFAIRPGAEFDTDGSIGYRVKDFTEYFRINEQRENTESLILRWNTRWRPWRRAMDLTTRYEASTERTPTLQEIYIQTGPELGQFVWEDTNQDGAIQIDEFLPERTPNEGTYIQTFVPSDSLSSIISVRGLVRLQVDPSRIWGKDVRGLRKILRQISSRTTFDVQEKSREPNIAQIYLLNLNKYRSSLNTLNGRLRFAQDVSLFRPLPKIGVDLSFNQLRTLSELAAGEESRFLNAWSTEARYAPSRTWGFKLRAEKETNRLDSETFASRRYRIEGVRLEPEVAVNFTSTLSLVGLGIWAKKKDAIGDREVTLWRFPFELRYRRLKKAQITARAEVAVVDLTGEALGLAAFELTDGRGAGTSYLWGVQSNFTLNQFLQFTFTYDGRAPASAPTLHTVRMQLSAVF